MASGLLPLPVSSAMRLRSASCISLQKLNKSSTLRASRKTWPCYSSVTPTRLVLYCCVKPTCAAAASGSEAFIVVKPTAVFLSSIMGMTVLFFHSGLVLVFVLLTGNSFHGSAKAWSARSFSFAPGSTYSGQTGLVERLERAATIWER